MNRVWIHPRSRPRGLGPGHIPAHVRSSRISISSLWMRLAALAEGESGFRAASPQNLTNAIGSHEPSRMSPGRIARSSGAAAWPAGRKPACVPDPAEPVGRVAGVGLASVRDRVPVGGELRLAQVVRLLRGLVARGPIVEDLEEPGGEGQDLRPSDLRQKLRQALFAGPSDQAGPGRRTLDQGRPEVGPEPGQGQGRDDARRLARPRRPPTRWRGRSSPGRDPPPRPCGESRSSRRSGGPCSIQHPP